MNTIVFISTNKSGSSRDAIKAAERLGFFTVLLTDKPQFIEQRLEFPDVHQLIHTELSNYNALKKSIKNIQSQGKKIKLILSFIDPYVNVAASLTEEFCISIKSPDHILNMEDKVLTRNIIKDLPMSPYFSIYTPGEDLQNFVQKQNNRFPLVVKSPMSAGSKDVLKVNSPDQLTEAIQHFKKKYELTPILVEEYLTGPQYLVETLVHDGKVNIVAIIKQEITFQKRFIVTGYSLLPHINKKLYNQIFHAVTTIVEAFQMKNGACHLEMRLVDGQWKLIEVNPRISGGAMNRIIEVGYGINLVEETIQLLLGNKPNLKRKHSKNIYVHYITIDKKGILVNVTGRNKAASYPGVEEVYIKPRQGKKLRPPLSMGDRYGYVLASSDSEENAKKIAQNAAKEISFNLDQTDQQIKGKQFSNHQTAKIVTLERRKKLKQTLRNYLRNTFNQTLPNQLH
ncbi:MULTISPECIES: ATP-grasp domain-containing protein [unclassified Bacillus (in: firmicutes)]|uniref:ATP-grasp domain-containing protein n=1 Tax=unclassified Bacillus (in: firmicutes) TaxID=185979 RepID=UPI001BE7CEA1|nr:MULTISPECIES: ATP-grasp domain-containing protein [unclassified Bacillus (in: firmicutes)]MBT2618672.1 ATP-grasp domain-containing protein [Bacillus sp. ISL-78]MBT2719206.1 ATP-grasp domain-containing protein [Bacillus sp. ISL-57]